MPDPLVLVADDDEMLLQLMSRRLGRMGGLRIEKAENGRQALDRIANTRYDLIVTDIYMPGVTGLELLKQAKQADPHVQVVVVTAAATLDNAIEALNNGAFAYLTKPFDHLSVFDNVVSRALQFRRLVMDNLRLADIQRRRGDLLEEEVTDRVHQLQRSRRELLDLISCMPDGVMVVEPGARIVITNPIADGWLLKEKDASQHPIHDYLKTLPEEWAAQDWEIDVENTILSLHARELPLVNQKRRWVVTLKSGTKTTASPELMDGLVELKHGLAWLYGQDLDERTGDRVAYLAKLAADVELHARDGIHPGAEMPSTWTEMKASTHDPFSTEEEHAGVGLGDTNEDVTSQKGEDA